MSKSARKKESLPHISNAKALYLRLFRYAWQHKTYFLITLVAIALLSASNTAFLALIKQLTDEGFAKQSTSKTTYLPLMLFALMAFRGIASFVSNYSLRLVARRVVAQLRIEAFANLMRVSVNLFDASSTSILVSKLTYDVERLSIIVTRSAMNVVRDVLTIELFKSDSLQGWSRQ